MARHYKNEPYEEKVSWRMTMFQLRRLCGDEWNGYVNDVYVPQAEGVSTQHRDSHLETKKQRNKVTRAPKSSAKSYSTYRHVTDYILKIKSKETP